MLCGEDKSWIEENVDNTVNNGIIPDASFESREANKFMLNHDAKSFSHLKHMVN